MLTATLRKWGGSVALPIPPAVLSCLGLQSGTEPAGKRFVYVLSPADENLAIVLPISTGVTLARSLSPYFRRLAKIILA